MIKPHTASFKDVQTGEELRYAWFDVDGLPRPQGSKSIGKGGRMYESARGLKPWRQTIMGRAKLAATLLDSPLRGPLEATVIFYLPKGKTVKRKLPSVKPDLDKLMRALGDSITQSQLIRDDADFTDLVLRKRYGSPDYYPQGGVQVCVSEKPDLAD